MPSSVVMSVIGEVKRKVLSDPWFGPYSLLVFEGFFYKVTLRSPFVYSLGDVCGVVHCPFVLLCSFNVY